MIFTFEGNVISKLYFPGELKIRRKGSKSNVLSLTDCYIKNFFLKKIEKGGNLLHIKF